MRARPSSAARWCWRRWPPGSARGGGGRSPSCCWRRSWRFFFRDPDRVIGSDVARRAVAGRWPGDGRGPGRAVGRARGRLAADQHLPVADGRPHQPRPVRRHVDPRHLPAGPLPARLPLRIRRRRTSAPSSGSSATAAPSCSARWSACWRGASSAACRKARRSQTGDRFGLMKFGSRMDVFVDRDARLLVKAGRHRAGGGDAARRVPAARGRHAVLKAAPLRADGAASIARRMRRGAYLLPSLLTLGNLFCGYACVIFALRHELRAGGDVHRLRHRPRHARRTRGADDRHVERVRRRVRLARRRRLVRHGAGRPVLRVGPAARSARLGWAAGFLFVSAAAIRLARFNIQTNVPGAGQALLRRHAEPGRRRRARGDGLRVPQGFVAGWPTTCWRCRWCWCRPS